MGKYVQQSGFEVFVVGRSTSLEDWRRSLQAPATELPELTGEERAFAKRFGIADEKYARSRLSLEYGQERMLKRGRDLGDAVVQILVGLAPAYRLHAAIYEATKLRWVVQIQAPQGAVNVAIPIELADDIVDSNTVQDQQRLRELLATSFEQSERIGKK